MRRARVYVFMAGQCISAAAAAFWMTGCVMLPMPDRQVPAARSAIRVDPRRLCAASGPVHLGATREEVHRALGLGVDESAEPPAAEELYWFYMRAGSFLFIGANPEGGFVGVNKRYVMYDLKILFDDSDRVTSIRMTHMEVLDPHEPARGPYE